MALLDDILIWATQELKPWQSDAVRRLFQKVELEPSDFQELASMLKVSMGIAVEPSAILVAPVPLAATHLPATNPDGPPVILEALHSLKSVNRLAPDQRLNFLSNGLTVVYGDNGAGKSGYSRVVKSACRARVKDEAVLPDARETNLFHETPQASFAVTINGQSLEIPWRADADGPPELSSVAVLDTRCARAYTDKEGELIFAPLGFDVFENLARVVYPAIETIIRTEQNALPTSEAAFNDLKTGKTAVARFLASVDHTTSEALVEQACAFSIADAERLTTLESALLERSPKERAQSLRGQALRLDTLLLALHSAGQAASDAEVERIQGIDLELANCVAAEAVAASALRGGGQLIAGTGEGPWRTLFLAAQRFVEGHGHAMEQGDPCPLCQVPLDVEEGRQGFM